MVETGAGARYIFRQLDQIEIAYMHHQAHGYFGLLGIGNVVNEFLPNPLVVPPLQNLSINSQKITISTTECAQILQLRQLRAQLQINHFRK